MMRIGIDLGGTKIEGIALDDGGAVLARRRVPTPAREYHATLAASAALVHELERHCGARASVGVGTPGALSRLTGTLKNANSICLNGQALDRDLAALLQRPVRIANDANCLALSEATAGAGAGAAVVFAVLIGTGTGAGIAVHGRIVEGGNASAGEWGHKPLPWPGDDERPGPAWYCGKYGCSETYLSGPGLARDYRAHGGAALTAEQIAACAAAGEVLAQAALDRYEDRMARALATVINLLDPEVIVLGGGLSQITRLYSNVSRRWTDYVFSDRVDTQLVVARHGDASGVRGAAWLWPSGGEA